MDWVFMAGGRDLELRFRVDPPRSASFVDSVGEGRNPTKEGLNTLGILQAEGIESKFKGGMRDAELVARLSEIAVRLEIDVRLVPGEFSGGSCRVKGRKVLFLNASMPPRGLVEVLCRALARENLCDVFVLPAVRELIEEHAAGGRRQVAGEG